MDIFVEPVLPHPSLVIFGASPVAMSLAAQARQLGYHVTLAAPAADLAGRARRRMSRSTVLRSATSTRRAASSWFRPRARAMKPRLRAALAIDAEYHAFVGSRRKMAALREKLIAGGIDA